MPEVVGAVMGPSLTKEPFPAVNIRFVRDSELGWGRTDPASGTIAFFDSPMRSEVVLPVAGRTYQAARLPPQQRVWWFDGARWIIGRIDSPRNAEADAYFVHLPNGSTKILPSAELRVRWSVPLTDPLGLLKAGTVETRFFHTHRTRFLHTVLEQRSASLSLGGILSSAVEIHDHQVGAARRVLADPIPRYLLADEVGLGKTIEAGMVLRQLLLDMAGSAVVIVPDQVVGQWKRELAMKFRVHYLPGTVEVIAHSAIGSIRPEPRMLTIVDEAHRFTERVNYGGNSPRDQQYDALRTISHASKALLLLSATPVRSNEDAFLGLLHLLDPVNYPLTDLAAFRHRVEMRDDLAQAMSAINAETPLRYLDEPLTKLSQLLPNDPVAKTLISDARRCIGAGVEDEARREISALRVYISETYRLHRRMVRNRRSTAVKKGFPARGRQLADPWLLPDPDHRRQDLFAAFDDLRLGLELEEHPKAGYILQIILGRILAPIVSLEDLVRALRGNPDHDLSAGELNAVDDLMQSVTGQAFAGDLEQIMTMATEADRLSAAVEWARQRVGRQKYAVACTFPNTARLVNQLLVNELGSHRVTALLENQGESLRSRLTTEFKRSTERSILVIDRSAEEATNLQLIEEVLHLNMPTFSTHLEQRLGRFDRWSELHSPVRSVTFREAFAIGRDHIDAWTMTLNDVFGAFTSSTSTLQYVLTDLEREFFQTAVTETLAGAREQMLGKVGELTIQHRRISGQDILDSIEDRAQDEDLARRLATVDAGQRQIDKAVHGYLVEMLRFSVFPEDDYVRFGVSKSNPPLLTEDCVRAIGTQVFKQGYTSDRITAESGLGFLRWGEPLVNAFAQAAEIDDRGKAFAIEVQWPSRQPDREPWVAFCFDVKIAPAPIDLFGAFDPDGTLYRAVQARTESFLPTTMERVWWLLGRREGEPSLIRALEQAEGVNLGSRPERFRELTAPFNWPRVCDDVFRSAMAAVHGRDRVIQRLDEARRRATAAHEWENVILQARSRIDGESPSDETVMAAVNHSLAHPVFNLDSCGAAFITWVFRP
ncbi:protein DpdE [Nonomuraea guangzhouensis]|uniref:Protein DpdE n=1 Tax=Nonomuraea guangzhouensis TaxID=1291555 RepID=A0ABW4GWX7_9ACTN|nr:protein DpdE [Nonomuraea guangzhouensis]